MPRKINTSVNIVRDINAEIDYLPTPNGIKTIGLISNDFKKGLRSFNIIGSYGTGKSSFLWAFQKSLTNEKSFFNLNILNSPKTEIIVCFINELSSWESSALF